MYAVIHMITESYACSERGTLLYVRLQNNMPVLLGDARCYTYDYTIIVCSERCTLLYVWLHNHSLFWEMYAVIHMITESYACSERCTLIYVWLQNNMPVLLRDARCYTYDYTIIVCSERCMLLYLWLQNHTPVLLRDARYCTYDYAIIVCSEKCILL